MQLYDRLTACREPLQRREAVRPLRERAADERLQRAVPREDPPGLRAPRNSPTPKRI